MTISTTTRKAGPFIGDGLTVAYPFSFKVFSAADLLVVQSVLATGVETTKVLTTDYTVALNADQNATPGGTVTMLASAPIGTTTTLTSQVAYTQSTDLTNAGGFYPKVINDALDRATIQIQQLGERIGRLLGFPLSDSALSTTMPGAATRANKLLGFDGSGAPVVVTPSSQSAADVTLQMANSADPTKGSALVGFNPGSGAGRSVQSKLRETVSVKDFGAVGDGVTNDSPAFQLALNYLQGLSNGGALFVPRGEYLLAAALTYTSKPLYFYGEGMQATRLNFSTASAGIQFSAASVPGNFPPASAIPECVFRDFSLVANAAAAGDALQIFYPAHGGVETFSMVDNVGIFNNGAGYWTNGIHSKNVADGMIRRTFILLPGSSSTTCLFIDNNLTQPNFGVTVDSCSFNGAATTVQCSGWLESLYLKNSAFVGGTDIIVCDGAGTTNGCADLKIIGCHVNAKRTGIKTNLWRAVFISATDAYSGVGSGDVAGDNIALTSADKVQITGCKVEAGVVSVARNGITLGSGAQGCTNVDISGNTINVNSSGIITSGATTNHLNITGNIILGNNGLSAGTGIFLGTGSVGEYVVSGNSIGSFTTGLSVNSPGCVARGNSINGCTNGVVSTTTGVDARGNVVSGATTAYSANMRRDFAVTVSLTPGAVATGTSGATGVALTGAAFGDAVQVGAPASLGNVAATVFINGANSGVMLITNNSGGSITPPAGNYTFYVSN